MFEIERFEIEKGVLPRAPTNVQGTELRVREREVFEIEGSRDREILLYFEMAVVLDVSKIFEFCFQIQKAKRILFRQYLNRFLKFSIPDVQRAKTVKIIFFENGAPFCNYDVIKKKFFLEKCSFTS